MAINERLIDTEVAAAGNGGGGAEAEQGLILHLDANDVDSYDGDGTEWVDISTFEKTIPISDNASNLKCHLNFTESTSYDGTGTTVTDISDESNDFSFVNVTSSDFGKDNGGYLDFDGTNDYLQRTSSISGIFNNDYALEWWIKPDEANNFTLLYSKNAANSALLIGNFGGSAGQLELYRYKSTGGTTSGTFTSSGITSGQWNHVAIVFSGTVANLYVDGNYKSQITGFTGTYFSDFTETNLLGNYSSDTFDTDGKLGVFRIYDIALSASDIGQNYRHGRDIIYTDLIPDTDLELHYDPADTSSYSGTGTTFTDLAGNNNGDLLGGIENSYNEEIGNYFEITGSGDGITTSNAVSINPATDGMTVEMWVNTTSNTQNYIFSFDGTGTTYFGLSYRAPNNRYLWFYRNSSGSVTSLWSKAIPFNEWVHLTITTDGSSAQFYTNGELETDISYPSTTTDNAYNVSYNEDLHFGNLYDLAQNTNTKIGQIRFYKSGLTQDQIFQNYNFTKPSYPNGNDGTISGATWYPDGYFDFDGTNDFIQTDLTISSSSVTTSLWFNADAADLTNFIHYFQNNGGRIDIAIAGTGSNSATVSTQSINVTCTTATSQWNHLAIVYTGWANSYSSGSYGSAITAKVYLNDSLVATVSPTPYGQTTGMRIGRSGGGYYYDGKVSKVKVFDKELTSSEITALYNEGE